MNNIFPRSCKKNRSSKVDIITGIIHSRKYFPQKVSIRKKLGAKRILLGKTNTNFSVKIFFWGPNTWYIQAQKTTSTA